MSSRSLANIIHTASTPYYNDSKEMIQLLKPSQQYMREVKSLFPIMGRAEKKYLSKLADSVEDFCAEEGVASVSEIIHDFGEPCDVVSTYIGSIDSSRLVKKIRISKWVKRCIATLLLFALIGLGIYAHFLYENFKIFKQEQFYFDETEITD